MVRNQQAPRSSAQQEFVAHKLDANARAARYDKLVASLRAKKRVEPLTEEATPLNRTLGPAKFRFPEPLYDVKEYKQRFLSGSGNITGFCELNEAKLSDY